MRLFAAVVPPMPVAGELAEAVAALRELPGADRLRWTRRHGWHFTLAFFGEVAEKPLPDLHRRLARAAHRHSAYELSLAGGGRFGHRALWAGATGDVRAMARLAATAVAAGRRAGLSMPDEHPGFTPHLTLARNNARARRGGGDPERRSDRDVDLRPYVEALAGFAGTPWTVSELALIRSHPPAPGMPGAQPHYETVALWPLGRPEPAPGARQDRDRG
ncbi:RNA 2',3'-cyclic phosphodiesterase [Streptomyces sp. F63]|uniref:RNA 2',3'-cyclic phosphodiesterase n=1 Tax=Streptomyces sp. F63 TaxID=2824887 RepID=UPI001B37EE92|nr:RNA 2',3'-cyclic phosphodiesterase [Streptomyces sp. F63]MBQ0986602.1 RNA 2',3'-cyclic phosphodiesterase [Streptomyces sp. F63]